MSQLWGAPVLTWLSIFGIGLSRSVLALPAGFMQNPELSITLVMPLYRNLSETEIAK